MCSTAMHTTGTDMYLILGSEDPNPVGVGGKSESNKYGCEKGWEAESSGSEHQQELRCALRCAQSHMQDIVWQRM